MKRWAIVTHGLDGSRIVLFDEYADALIASREQDNTWGEPTLYRLNATDNAYEVFEPYES